MHQFDTNLFIVGGTGIAAAVPYILAHLERVEKSQTKTSRIHLVWSVRQREMYDQVFTDDLAQILRNNDTTTTIYCTELLAAPLDSQSNKAETLKMVPAVTASGTGSSTQSGGVQFLPGRPNVREIMMAEVEESKASSSSLGVFTCGPAQMADECRSSVYQAMKDGFHAIDYFEEAFGW